MQFVACDSVLMVGLRVPNGDHKDRVGAETLRGLSRAEHRNAVYRSARARGSPVRERNWRPTEASKSLQSDSPETAGSVQNRRLVSPICQLVERIQSPVDSGGWRFG